MKIVAIKITSTMLQIGPIPRRKKKNRSKSTKMATTKRRCSNRISGKVASSKSPVKRDMNHMSRLKYSIVIPKFSIRGINNSIKSLKIKLINSLLNRSQTRYTKSGCPRPRRSLISRRTRARPTSGAAPKRAPATRRRGLYKATLTGAGCTRSRCTMARLCKSRSTI